MEEAEVLCDRLGIFVDGSLQCVGNPKEVINIALVIHIFKKNDTIFHTHRDDDNLNQPILPIYNAKLYS